MKLSLTLASILLTRIQKRFVTSLRNGIAFLAYAEIATLDTTIEVDAYAGALSALESKTVFSSC